MFWPPHFLGGGPPEFLDLDYKIQTVSDHVAKFRGNRPRNFGERVAKGKNTSRAKWKTSRTTVPGGLNIVVFAIFARDSYMYSAYATASASPIKYI